MPPRKQASTPSSTPAKAAAVVSSSASAQSKSAAATLQSLPEIVADVWARYVRDTPSRVKALDALLGFLVVVGVAQFAYCVVGGGYPFNAFLSGFGAAVGQFVLAASLRMQTNPANKAEFQPGMSDERAFADFVLGSVILHFFCVNFIN